MKRSIITLSLSLALGVVPTALFAQHEGAPQGAEPVGEHSASEADGPGHGPAQSHEGHALTEGFHAPATPFNMASYPPPAVHEEHDGAVTEVKGPPPFLGPLINFAILLVLGYMAVRRQINPALAARKAAVETEIAEAKRLHDEAQALHKEYSDRIEHLDAEVAALKSDLQRQGELERDRIVADATARAERMRAEGAQMIEQEMRQLREELRREAVLSAASAAEEAVKKSITAADQQRLVDEFVQSLDGARTTEGASA